MREERAGVKDQKAAKWREKALLHNRGARNGKQSKKKAKKQREAEAKKNSVCFNNYYKRQRIVSEEEWDTWLETLIRPLPMALRINRSLPGWESSMEILKQGPPGTEAFRWYPGNRAWQCPSSGYRSQDKEIKAFKQWCEASSRSGLLSFQEMVSMIPALCLSPKYGEVTTNPSANAMTVTETLTLTLTLTLTTIYRSCLISAPVLAPSR